jgi:NADH:ubiquinone oxidoreductase subunit F (NADH-binding)
MFYEELLSLARKSYSFKNDKVLVCVAAGCLGLGSDKILKKLKKKFANYEVKQVGCIGLCSGGPLIRVEPEGAVVSLKDIKHIDHVVEKIISLKGKIPEKKPFFEKQLRVVLENSGLIDPERIEDYIIHGGYRALLGVLQKIAPEEVVKKITNSGLRGRGGGGYPTGLKWNTVAKMDSKIKYVVCNADEGDPGAFMDRTVLESDPHKVIEGMIIAAYAIGAAKGYIYVRAEYPLATRRLNIAIRQAKKYGLIGKNIAGSKFSFSVEVRTGAGAYVCGEETALIASIEGKRGSPRPRPPYPAQYGIKGHPTLINNVETFASVAPIIDNGDKWYSSMGTEKSKGTKTFAIAGDVKNTGLIEVPLGITLREVIYDVGGGIKDGKGFKAVQTGGPMGGCIPESMLDIPIDY